jgi:hypothetical protein
VRPLSLVPAAGTRARASNRQRATPVPSGRRAVPIRGGCPVKSRSTSHPSWAAAGRQGRCRVNPRPRLFVVEFSLRTRRPHAREHAVHPCHTTKRRTDRLDRRRRRRRRPGHRLHRRGRAPALGRLQDRRPGLPLDRQGPLRREHLRPGHRQSRHRHRRSGMDHGPRRPRQRSDSRSSRPPASPSSSGSRTPATSRTTCAAPRTPR